MIQVKEILNFQQQQEEKINREVEFRIEVGCTQRDEIVKTFMEGQR